jgi:hypothetical protein
MIKDKRTRSITKQQRAQLEVRHRQKVLASRVALGALLIVLLLIGYRLLNNTVVQAHKSLGNEVLGTWVNSNGFRIEFRSGGSGFIPGVPGAIPDSTFSYSIIDDTHIQINLQGQIQTIEIRVTGDQLTWKDALGEVTYQRVK